jgi:RHS repeat-associated protein
MQRTQRKTEDTLIKPYGESFGANGTPQTSYGYTGEPTDGNQLVHLRRRYLSPALGQFVSLDPLEVFNRYAYVNGNPIMRTDPSGMLLAGGGGTFDPCSCYTGSVISACRMGLVPACKPTPTPTPSPESGSLSCGSSQPNNLGCICEQQCSTFAIIHIPFFPIFGTTPTVDERCMANCLASNAVNRCKIEVAGVALNLPLIYETQGSHAAIIFTDRSGQEYVFRAGQPINRPVCRPKAADEPFGRICSQGEPICQSEDQELIDTNNHPRQVLLTGEAACSKELCLYDIVALINQANLKYDVFNNNSNSAAYTFLSRCGIPTLTPPSGYYVGWGKELDLPSGSGGGSTGFN